MKTVGQLLKFLEASIKQLEKTYNLIQRVNTKPSLCVGHSKEY